MYRSRAADSLFFMIKSFPPGTTRTRGPRALVHDPSAVDGASAAICGYNICMAPEIRNNPEQDRYELSIDDELVGVAEYRVEGDVVIFPHTEIERSRRGKGLGAQLVQYA